MLPSPRDAAAAVTAALRARARWIQQPAAAQQQQHSQQRRLCRRALRAGTPACTIAAAAAAASSLTMLLHAHSRARARPPRTARSHLKDLMADQTRCEALIKEDLGLYCDFSRQRMTQDTIKVRRRRAGTRAACRQRE